MTGKIKPLGLAVIAAMALSAIAASAANAGELHVTGTGAARSANLTGQITTGTKHTLSIVKTNGTSFTVQAEEASLECTLEQATVTGQVTAQEATCTPTYGKLKVNGIAAQVKPNGCKYTLTNTGVALTANVDIVGCTSGKKIEIKPINDCLITIPAQNNLAHVVFVNEGSGSTQDVKTAATLTLITIHEVGTECPDPGTHETVTASYSGETTVKAFVDAGVGTVVTKHSHQYTELSCGAQLGLFGT